MCVKLTLTQDGLRKRLLQACLPVIGSDYLHCSNLLFRCYWSVLFDHRHLSYTEGLNLEKLIP